MARTEYQNNVQPFTFVGYEVNSKGVSDRVRSHLIELRARNKRDAQANSIQWKQSQKQIAMLPSVFIGVEKQITPLPKAPRREAIGLESTSRAISQKKKPMKRSKPPSNSSQVSSKGLLPKASPELSGTGSDRGSPTLPVTCVQDQLHASAPLVIDFNLSFLDLGKSSFGEVVEIDGEGQFGRISSEGQRLEPIDNTDVNETDNRQLAFQSAVIAVPWSLCPADLALYQYFRANGTKMLGFHLNGGIELTHKPVEDIFLPIASSARWCFETVVLLLSAYHQRGSEANFQEDLDRQIATIQHQVLQAARDRVSAIAEDGDSTDGDVLAFLFLAIIEFRFGCKKTGAIHLDAWQRYMIMRRDCGVERCSTKCKVAVWWCSAMLLAPEVPLPSFLDCKIVERIQENPARLFRCLAEGTSEGDGV